MEKELVICYLYFNNDKKVANFFRKLNNYKTITETVSSMACDLAYLIYMYLSLGIESEKNDKIIVELHDFITFDV